jgi:ABC-type ATPase involved in cell division
MADALSAERLAFMPSINHISAVYVTGIAGSGKSSSVKVTVEILEDR